MERADNPPRLRVEVAYARPERQVILPLEVEEGTTLREAVERSGILAQFPEIDLASNPVGVFGKAAALDRVLRAGDRVEVYRPLVADPKEVRKRRAAAESARHEKGD